MDRPVLKIKRLLVKAIVFLLAFFTLVSSLNVGAARADELRYPFDYSSVLSDLQSADGFNLLDYPEDLDGIAKAPGIINFVEWCYSPKIKEDFALYVYFYNPQRLKISVVAPSNRIQMASAYKYEDGTPAGIATSETIPNDYDTFNLVYCNDYDGLIYKFRIVDQVGADGLTIQERVNMAERRYDVSGIVLYLEDGTGKEFTVGGTYFFTGYAAGYGENADDASTLENTKFLPLETVRLEVHHTNYRTATSSQGAGHKNDLNTVYFNIPNRYLNEYGKLQKIKAEWHEYETEPIYVINNLTVYNQLKKYVGKKRGAETGGLNYGVGALQTYTQEGHTSFHYYNTFYDGSSIQMLSQFNPDAIVETCIDYIYYLFPADYKADSIAVTSEQLRSYVETYTATANKGYLPVKTASISADLFKDTLEDGSGNTFDRVGVPYVDDDVHHKLVEFDANDKFDILSAYGTANNIFLKWYYEISGQTENNITDVSPIVYGDVVDDVINANESTIESTLLLNKKDLNDFKAVYNAAKANDETTVLFRFAQTDYYATEYQTFQKSPYKEIGGIMVAEETVFLDFKIIQLTFQNDNAKYTVIPVTQNPIDIYNDITFPETSISWWQVVLAIAFVVVVGIIGILLLTKLFNVIGGLGNVAQTIAYTGLFVLIAAWVYLAVGMVIYLVALF